MAADQYCLKWNNHQSTLLVQFETLLESDSLTDCTLSAEGKYLNVHKVLLSACSPYFSKLLGEHKDKHPIFFMKDVAFEELKGIVEYMYKGEVNIMQERLDSFLKTASSLQIKGLADQDGGKGEDREEDPGGGRVKRKQAPDLRGGYGESSPIPEEPPRSPKRRRRPRPVSQDDSLPAQDQNHCDTTTAPAFSQLQQQQDVVMPTPLVPVKKTEPVDNSMVHLKTEIPDDVPQVDVQDLTLDDDEEFNNEDITQPGTSFSETSQDFAQWQQQMATQSGADESSFMPATQGINQSGSQDVEEEFIEEPDEPLIDPETGKYLCYCGRQFGMVKTYNSHKTRCGIFKCDECGFTVTDSNFLKKHMRFNHPVPSPCDESADRKRRAGCRKSLPRSSKVFCEQYCTTCDEVTFRSTSKKTKKRRSHLRRAAKTQSYLVDYDSDSNISEFSRDTEVTTFSELHESKERANEANKAKPSSIDTLNPQSTMMYDDERLHRAYVKVIDIKELIKGSPEGFINCSQTENINEKRTERNFGCVNYGMNCESSGDDLGKNETINHSHRHAHDLSKKYEINYKNVRTIEPNLNSESDDNESLYFDDVCRNAFPVSHFGDLPLRTMSFVPESKTLDGVEENLNPMNGRMSANESTISATSDDPCANVNSYANSNASNVENEYFSLERFKSTFHWEGEQFYGFKEKSYFSPKNEFFSRYYFKK